MPIVIVAISILLVIFRKPMDLLLSPLDTLGRLIPRRHLVICGLAAPMALSFYYYYLSFGGNTVGRENEFALKTVGWGLFLSHVLLRMSTSNGPSEGPDISGLAQP